MPATATQLAAVLVDTLADASPEDARAAAGSFIQMLAAERRLALLPRVVRAIDRAWRDRFGASSVRVFSAVPLGSNDIARLERLAPGADLTLSVDPSLIGGAVIRLDDRLLDGSVAGELHRLEEALVK